MIGSKPLSEIKRELKERFQGNSTVKAWLNREIKACAAKGTTVSEDLLWMQELVEGEPIPSASRRPTKPTAEGKKAIENLIQITRNLEAELAKAKPTSRRKAQTTTAKKKTRKRTTASAAN